ncbi:hypothetical protein T492DRAFT_867462 [Pavlovales sp. CCMP2436]|nr:hypothetical protein T492DRAFT_867462 [Pavlovales sp. CCMP2436]
MAFTIGADAPKDAAMSSRQPWAAQLPDWLAFVGALTQLQLLLSGVLAIVEEEDEANVRLLQSTVPVFVLTPVEVMELVLRDEPEVEDEVDYTEESRLKMKQARPCRASAHVKAPAQPVATLRAH